MATREAEICQRLEALDTSFIRKTGVEVELDESQLVDLLLNSLSSLEGNSVRVQTLLTHSRRAFLRLQGHFFPHQPLAEDVDFLELIKKFSTDPDPVPEYRRAAMKTGVEVVMAMAMAHGERTN